MVLDEVQGVMHSLSQEQWQILRGRHHGRVTALGLIERFERMDGLIQICPSHLFFVLPCSIVHVSFAWGPLLLPWRPSLPGWRPSLLGWRPSLVGRRPSLLGWRPLLLGFYRPCLFCLNQCRPSPWTGGDLRDGDPGMRTGGLDRENEGRMRRTGLPGEFDETICV